MKDEILGPFSDLAREFGLIVRPASPTETELVGPHHTLHVADGIDRTRGIFVTIARSEAPQRQVGLSYLVEYRGGSQLEAAATVGNEPRAVCHLIRRFAGGLLRGELDDFPDLYQFAMRKVAERFPAAHLLKTNKWIRAEWTDPG
jgi:hypothetical protein